MKPFLVCIHDATPAYARETRLMLRDLAPLLGRRLSFGVVPDWHGEWPLAAHPDYCRLNKMPANKVPAESLGRGLARNPFSPGPAARRASDGEDGIEGKIGRKTGG